MADGDDGQEEGQRDRDEGEDVGVVDDGVGIGTERSSSRSFACADGQRDRA